MGAGLPLILSRTSAALAAQALEGTSVEKHPERILVVVELAGPPPVNRNGSVKSWAVAISCRISTTAMRAKLNI